MALNREKIQHVSKPMELMFKGGYIVYGYILESKQLGRAFKLI